MTVQPGLCMTRLLVFTCKGSDIIFLKSHIDLFEYKTDEVLLTNNKPGCKNLRLCIQSPTVFNPYLMNGLSYHYQLDESTFIFRGSGCSSSDF